MQEYTWTQLIKNSPEWVGVIASSLFAAITAIIIWRQKRAMDRQVNVTRELGEATNRILMHQTEILRLQGEISAQHQRTQNVILRLQHEHDWLTAYNARREKLLRTVTTLHTLILTIVGTPAYDARGTWSEFLQCRSDMKSQLDLLDAAAFTKETTGWYAELQSWNAELFKIITNYFDTTSTPGYPSDTEQQSLKELEHKLNPIRTIYALQRAIQNDTEEFKKRWEAEVKV